MIMRRRERCGEAMFEVQLEDWQSVDESQEQFEERMIRLLERMTLVGIPDDSEFDSKLEFAPGEEPTNEPE